MARFLLRGGAAVLLSCALLATALSVPSPEPAGAIGGTLSPSLHVQVVADGLSLPWDLADTPDGVLLFTERPGRLNARMSDGEIRRVDADLSDLFVRGETGLLGLTLHPDFAQNRRFYTCQGHSGPQIQVIGWTIGEDYRTATRFADPLVGGIELLTGRHGGCRLRFDLDGSLFVATGDAASSTAPQSLTSLAGKVLRVDPDTGEGWPGNPFAESANANTRRIYSYGHRNIQGISRRPGTNEMWTVEHGPDRDDEINRIVAGGNYGWDPGPGYAENVPMTDLAKFPGAVEAAWDTGRPTLAMAGGFWINGRHWGPLDGTLAVASLKNSTLRFFDFDGSGDFLATELGDELTRTYGRLRTPMAGPRGTLYVTTSNGSDDKILRITPTGAPIGNLDVVRVRNGVARVKGWAIDPNRIRPTSIRVLIDGEEVTTRTARTRRSDVGAIYADYGSRHGYSLRVRIPDGAQELCVEALDAGRRKQGPVELGCRSVG